ncbi:MAG: class I adenylate cyclase [Gammaproteobacteria bacterium]|nr:class I adenylate cyclase [Gammaproteobacteria bacterium]
MSEKLQTGQPHGNYDFAEIKQRFLKINDARLKRINADLRTSQREFLTLLPLLFHVNHPLLPGYVSKETPVGIPAYLPGQDALHLAQRISRSFEFKKKAYREFNIEAIYLMGSSGTIAYNDKSDFDIWLCHSESIEPVLIDELEEKAQGVQQWANDFGVEANIYLVNPKNLRKGEMGFLTNESSGSALDSLLLEEFYRTSVLLHGRYPLWWLVPPENEFEYEDYVHDLKEKRFIHSKEHIDFGGLRTIEASEFYGATLWLLYKGINAPYKSILKILLMQSYASEFPQIDMLGMQFKKSVYKGEEDLNLLDPYIMMLGKVEDFLKNAGDESRLQLARRSFYFKVNEKLSELNKSDSDNWRQQLLLKLVKKWNWTISDLQELDKKNGWKINQVLTERNSLIAEFKMSYRFLSNFAHRHVEQKNLIRQADLNVLGRKIYAAFERKAGKVDLVYRGITDQLFESHLSLHKLNSDNNTSFWVAFGGVVPRSSVAFTAPLKRSLSLVDLLCWCYFNRIINQQTIVGLYSNDTDLTDKEIRLLIANLDKHFSEAVLEERTTEDYRQPANIVANTTYINVGIDPLIIKRHDGTHISSERSDAFKYGSRHSNLMVTIDQILLTSWQEVLIFSYQGVNGLMACLKEYMLWSPPSKGRRPSSINASSFSSYRGISISKRVEQLFNTVYECFYSTRYAEVTRFILGVEWEYYILSLEDDNLHYHKTDTQEALVNYLSRPNETYSQYVFDVETLENHVLPAIYSINKPGLVQCFYEIKKDSADIYVIDEKGTLSYQEDVFYDVSTLMRHYSRFFDSIHNRMHFVAQQSSQDTAIRVDEVKFYMIRRDRNGKKVLTEQALNRYIRTSNYVSLQVIVDLINDKPVFTLFYENEEFSSLEYGSKLFTEVVRKVLQGRASKESYDIYVTDIDLSPAILNMNINSLQSSRYLYFKRKVEENLKKAVQQL